MRIEKSIVETTSSKDRIVLPLYVCDARFSSFADDTSVRDEYPRNGMNAGKDKMLHKGVLFSPGMRKNFPFYDIMLVKNLRTYIGGAEFGRSSAGVH
jgi:hypothetical protein